VTARQRKAMEFLWFKYGNGGTCHSLANHKYVQRFVEGRDADAEAYAGQITADCREAVARVKAGDFRELSEFAKGVVRTVED
jgi:hypothetical protein